MTHSVMSSPQGRGTASPEQRRTCFQRQARTLSPDFLSHLLTVELGRATRWGQLRAVSSLGREEEEQTVPGGPSERQLRNSPQERLPGTRENRAGLCLASQGTAAWAPALPTREAVFFTRSLAYPSLARTPSRRAAPSWTWDLGTGQSPLRPGQLWSRPLLVATLAVCPSSLPELSGLWVVSQIGEGRSTLAGAEFILTPAWACVLLIVTSQLLRTHLLS